MTATADRLLTETTLIADALGRLAPIGLDGLIEDAELLTRVDRKYLLPVAHVHDLLGSLAGQARVLEIGGARDFGYRSVYLDTAELRCFRAAGQGRRRRFKVRTRDYLDTGDSYLEVKSTGPRGTTVKARRPHPDASLAGLTLDGADFVLEALACSGIHDVTVWDLVPTMDTDYRRATLLVPGRGGRPSSRATIDLDLHWHDLLYDSPPVTWPGTAIVETKSVGAPGPIDRTLWRLGYRPARISKFGTGLACLRPYLPDNKWHRVMNRNNLSHNDY